MRLLTGLLLATAGFAAQAQERYGAYAGFGLRQFDHEVQSFGLSLDDSALMYKVYGGYRFNSTWALEAHYGQAIDPGWSESAPSASLANFSASMNGDYDIVEIRGLAHFNAFLIGLGVWDADVSAGFSGTSAQTGPFSFTTSDSDSGPVVIAGGEWDLGKLAIRAEVELFESDSPADDYLVGLGFHFRL